MPVADAVSGGFSEVGSKRVEGQQTRPTCIGGTSSCAKVKNVAGATRRGIASKQRRESPSSPPTLKLSVTSWRGRA